MISSPPNHQEQYIELLFRLYRYSNTYSWEPTLFDHEITRTCISSFGDGSFSECWEGIFLQHQKVVMKCSNPFVRDDDARRRILHEVDVWKDLRHPNILPLIGLYIHESTNYVVFPWMGAGNVLDYLEHRPRANRAKLVLEIARGLCYLHTHDPVIVHGNIRGRKILISDSGNALIACSYLSHRILPGAVMDGMDEMEDTWFTAGDPKWQAPELVTGNHESPAKVMRTTSSDMFAFGQVIIEIFQGEKFSDNTALRKLFDSSASIDPATKARMLKIAKECSYTNPRRRLTAGAVVSRLDGSPDRRGLLSSFTSLSV